MAGERADAILRAAREVLVADPSAPISEVAKRAGVGMSALYRVCSSKEELLARLCADGQRIYIAEAQSALDSDLPAWDAYVRFLKRIVERDTHALSSRLAGTFTPTPVHAELGVTLQSLSERLFVRVRASGAIRDDVNELDVGYLLEAISAITLGDPSRTATQRQRALAVAIDGLRAPGASNVPAPAPTWSDQDSRWLPRT